MSGKFDIVRIDLHPSEQYKSVRDVWKIIDNLIKKYIFDWCADMIQIKLIKWVVSIELVDIKCALGHVTGIHFYTNLIQ